MNRREFMRNSAIAMTAAGISDVTAKNGEATVSIDSLPRVGPKQTIKGKKAVASSDNPIVTETMLDVMKSGGNAVDAAVAGCLVQATVAPHMFEAKEHKVVDHLGQPALYLQSGIAAVENSQFTDGTIEFDISMTGGGYAG